MTQMSALLSCFLLPLGACYLLIRKKRNVWMMFVLGALAFFLSQILLRIPLLTALSSNYNIGFYFSFHPFIYLIFLAFTAGLFEETARYFTFRCTHKKHDTLWDALAFGLGHGGIEAILLVGIPLLMTDASLEQALLASFERMSAILSHVAFSLIVWWSVHKRAPWVFLLAILLHMGLDMLTGLPVSIYIKEGLFLLYGLGLWILCYFWFLKKEIHP